MRRALVPIVCGVALVAGAALAVWPAPRGAADTAGTGGTAAAGGMSGAGSSSPHTPVLSLRRAPGVLARLVAASRLSTRLDEVAAGAPATCLVVAPVRPGGPRAGPPPAPLYAHAPAAALIPASNLKLLTALAALEVLGPDRRLITEVRGRVGPGGVVEGDLWLVGGGDPLVGTADYAATFERQPHPFTDLAELARRVRAAGVTVVQGRVVGDESRYDTERYLPTWKPSYRSRNEIGPMSALTVNGNFATWRPVRVAAQRPALSAAAVFTGLLREAGVTVAGEPAEGVAPAGTPALARIESLPVAAIVGEMLRESDNLTAELLVKEMGRLRLGQGTTAAGTQVVRDVLSARGVPVAGLVLRDGSGLDRGDRASCQTLLAALAAAGPAGPLADGLAVAGRTGTLARRFVASPVAGRLRAKTGSLDGVAALSGFVTGAEGTTLAFAFVANGLPVRGAAGLALWDRLGAALATYPDAPAPAELGPR